MEGRFVLRKAGSTESNGVQNLNTLGNVFVSTVERITSTVKPTFPLCLSENCFAGNLSSSMTMSLSRHFRRQAFRISGGIPSYSNSECRLRPSFGLSKLDKAYLIRLGQTSRSFSTTFSNMSVTTHKSLSIVSTSR